MSTARALVAVGVFTLSLLFAAPASAVTTPSLAVSSSVTAVPQLPIPGLPDCQRPPVPESPDRGLSGFISPNPDQPPPLDADPFADGSGVSVYETNGLAGYRWHMYVDSCVPGPGQAINQSMTEAANGLMSLPVIAVGLVATLADVVYNQAWLQVLDEPVAYVSSSLYDGFTRPFFPVFAVAVGVIMIVSIRRARLSAAIGTGALVLAAATLAAFAANYPTRVADVTDTITSTAVVSVNGAIAGSEDADPSTATVSPLVEALLYDRWVAGTLGDATSPTARQYGPELYQASTLTWAERDIVRADPSGEGRQIIEAKQDQWRAAAEAVQDSDPDAYEYLTGARSIDRIGHAIVAVALIGVLPFLLMSLLLVAMSYLVIRLVVMFLPLVALIALLMRGTLRSLGSLVAAAIINSVVFTVGAAVTAYLYGVFLSPQSGMPALLGILLAFIVGIAMWIILSPYRRLTTMVRGNDAISQSKREYTRVTRQASSAVSTVGQFAMGLFTAKKAADAAKSAASAAEATSAPYRYGAGAIRPEHVAVADRAGSSPWPGEPPALTGAPVAAALPGPPARALPGPRRELGSSAAPTSTAEPSAAGRTIDTGAGQTTDAGPADVRDEDGYRARRPEMTPLRDFDAVVVDGQPVAVIHTLEGPVIDLDEATGPVVDGDVVASRTERGT